MAVNTGELVRYVVKSLEREPVAPIRALYEEAERARKRQEAMTEAARAAGLPLGDYKAMMRKRLGLSRRQFKKQFMREQDKGKPGNLG